MKHNPKANRFIRYVGILLVILVGLFISIAASSPSRSVSATAIAEYRAAQQDPELSDEEKIKAVIEAYFTLRYEGQKLLEAQDFSALLEDDGLDWVKKEKDKREIELYIATLFDLKYVSYSYTLEYDSIEIKNKKATVQLRESHGVVFEALDPEISEMANLEHTFALHYKKGTWLIYKHEYQDELSQQLDRMEKEAIIKQVDENYQKDWGQQNDSRSINGEPFVELALSTYSYNRSKAVAYADKYAYDTNDYYGRIFIVENGVVVEKDCANFVSQAIYAGMGKEPPDTSGMGPWGDDINQWYFDFYSKTGSSPWIGVPQQFKFITGNTAANPKKGPYGRSTTGLCPVRRGDIVQLQNKSTGSWFHEAIIVLSPYPTCQNPTLSMYQMDSHSTDYKRYPLSIWSSYKMRFILVDGWRGD